MPGVRVFCDGGAGPPVQATIAFIDDRREAYGVEPIPVPRLRGDKPAKACRLPPSTYHDRVARRRDPARLSARAQRDAALKVEVRRVFGENFHVYGVRAPRLAAIATGGLRVARRTVARLQEMGLKGAIRGKPIRTTLSDKATPRPLDKVDRQFRAPAPNMLCLSDFTYVSTWAGFVYARLIVGWRVSWTAQPTSCSMRWNRLSMSAAPYGIAG